MAIAMQDSKAMRGTKRVCAACEVRFYDLTREPIVCPSCGAQHTPVARPIIELGARAASHTGKTSWRSRSFKRPEPEPEVAEASAAVEDADEETPAPAPEEDVVLEQEPEEADVSGLVGHDVVDPKEQH
jgi:uncharacterized protein (TIGR02300 family)